MATAKFNVELAAELVTANRILVDQGVLDAFGHVSVRDDIDPSHFLLARNMAPGLVTLPDIIAYELDGTPIDAAGRKSYLERFIHGSIFSRYPQVKAVVHSHSPSVIPFGAVNVPMCPICHMASFLGTRTPVFEIREAGGPATDMLITNNDLGAALAEKLESAVVVLMRGHGDAVVGDLLRQVVFRAVYTEVNARLAYEAVMLGQGKVTYLNEAEAVHATQSIGTQIDRAWNVWSQRVSPAR